jgi:hypothetical protein
MEFGGLEFRKNPAIVAKDRKFMQVKIKRF